MSGGISEAVALFQSQLRNRRFDGRTLGILESVLVSRDVQTFLQTRTALRDVLRTEASSVMGGISEMTVDQKLRTVQFFVGAFAFVGDVESCLALKYEALILRESKYLEVYGLQVSYEEWLTFAKDTLDNGFYPIAIQGFEKALQCIRSNKIKSPEFAVSFMEEHTVDCIKKMKNLATSLVATNSVQWQSEEYLKRKAAQEQKCVSCSSKSNSVASSVFRSGINKRNMHQLHRSQALP